ncbi:MAG: ribosome silencing factor [Clostridia bacterium]|nr:ribosome silencing factor [Clostridia bacterium]
MLKFTSKQLQSRIGLVRAIYQVLDDKQAERIKVLKVEKQTSLCNYFVICEGRATTHVKALADELDEVLGLAGVTPIHKEGMGEGNWVALDYASVIVHIFDRPSREFYSLEKLWRDATVVDVDKLTSKE